MSGGEKPERRGGGRQRHTFKKVGLGPIEREPISALLNRAFAEADNGLRKLTTEMVVIGIKHVRMHAPHGGGFGPRAIEKNRRDLASLKKNESKVVRDSVLDFIGSRQRNMLAYEVRQLSNFHHLHGHLKANQKISSLMPAAVLDDMAHPKDWRVDLAAFVYLAITQVLGIEPSTSWYEVEPKHLNGSESKQGRGLILGLIFKEAARQAGATLPSSRPGMEALLNRGKDLAISENTVLMDLIVQESQRAHSSEQIEALKSIIRDAFPEGFPHS